MRILTAGPTGVVAMQRVLRWMADRQEEVWVVDHTRSYRSQVPAEFRFSPLLLPKGGRRFQQALQRAGLGSVAERLAVARLQRIAAEFQPEIVHLHNLAELGRTCVAAGLRPSVVSSWGALSQLVADPGRPLAESALAQLAATDAVIVDAPALIDPVRSLISAGARVEHLPMGADTRRFHPGRSATALEWRAFFGISDDTFVLLSPRSWAEFYGHQVILDAYAQAFPRLRRPAVLAFVGLGDGPQALPHMAKAWEAAKHTKAAGTLHWLPKIRYDEIHSLYSMSDAVINYPSMDSFAATLVEAAACELPIITADLPTYRGTFVETNCTLVPPGEPGALAEAMVAVVNQPQSERAARLSDARRVVEREYDDAVIMQRLWDLYAELRSTP